jgi:hypothetical protein
MVPMDLDITTSKEQLIFMRDLLTFLRPNFTSFVFSNASIQPESRSLSSDTRCVGQKSQNKITLRPDMSTDLILDILNISYENGSLNSTYDPPMSFRDRHRFLDAVYNSYPDPDGISAKNLENISRRAGLLMEEVLSWFEDEKARRARLLSGKASQSQESRGALPPTPADTTTPPQNSTDTLKMSQWYVSGNHEVLPIVAFFQKLLVCETFCIDLETSRGAFADDGI